MKRPAKENVEAHRAWLRSVNDRLLTAFARHPFLALLALRRLIKSADTKNAETPGGFYFPGRELEGALAYAGSAFRVAGVMREDVVPTIGIEEIRCTARWLLAHPELDAAVRLAGREAGFAAMGSSS